MPRGSTFSRMRPNTPEYSAVVQRFREEERASRHAKEAQIVPKETENAMRQQARFRRGDKTEQRKKEEENDITVIDAIRLGWFLEQQEDDMRRTDPKGAKEMYEDVRIELNALWPRLREDPNNQLIKAEIRAIAERYPGWNQEYKQAS